MSQSATRYEVRCHRCDVSFPIGTKRCVHCGGRIGDASFEALTLGGDDGVSVDAESSTEQSIEERASEAGGEPSGPAGAGGAGRLARSGTALVWILILAASFLTRLCQGE